MRPAGQGRYEVTGFSDEGDFWRATVLVDHDADEITHADAPLEWLVAARWVDLTSYVKNRPGWRVGEPGGVPHSVSPDAPTPIEDVKKR